MALPFPHVNVMWDMGEGKTCPSQYLSFDPRGGRRMCLWITAGQARFRHRRRSSALKLDKSTLFPPSLDKTTREVKAAKRLLGLRARRSRVTGLRVSALAPGKGCGKEGSETPS